MNDQEAVSNIMKKIKIMQEYKDKYGFPVISIIMIIAAGYWTIWSALKNTRSAI